MSKYQWGKRSRNRMKGLHPSLVAMLEELIREPDLPFDVTLLEGLRTQEQQAEYVRRKVSWTMNSRHLTGHAVDIAPLKDGRIDWSDHAAFVELSRFVFRVADRLGIVLQWGGDWDLDGEWRDEKKFDGPHYQIPWPYRMPAAETAQKQRMMMGRYLKRNDETDPPEPPDSERAIT